VLKKTRNNFNPFCIASYRIFNEYQYAYKHIIELIIKNTDDKTEAQKYINNLKKITINCNSYIDTTYEVLKERNNLNNEYKKKREREEREIEEREIEERERERERESARKRERERREREMVKRVLIFTAAEAKVKAKAEAEAEAKAEAEAAEAARDVSQAGGKRKSKGKSKKVSKKPVVSQKKKSECKEIFGKKMKIYKMPDSRKEYVKYKGELHHIADYKDLMKQKAKAKTKPKK
jgi:uncharacterized membrane protein YqiK